MNETAGPPPAAVETRGLAKSFGAIQALAGLDLCLPAGESVAVFGPNGAGKTTLIRLLTLALRPTAGSFRIAGLEPRRDEREIRARIGVISHHTYLYDDLTARQNLEFFGRLYGVAAPRERAEELLELVGLAARADDAAGGFSRGMQQRLSLARALVHEPSIVFLDEPFTGLDPHGARSLRLTLERLRAERRTVVLVTHNLGEGLELCERWLILARGRLLADGRSADADPAAFERHYFERLERGRPARVPA